MRSFQLPSFPVLEKIGRVPIDPEAAAVVNKAVALPKLSQAIAALPSSVLAELQRSCSLPRMPDVTLPMKG